MPSERFTQEAHTLQALARGRRIVLVSGNFNIIHPGHVRLLNFARTCGDVLVVALFDDGESGVFVDRDLRYEALISMASVDHIVTLKQAEFLALVETVKPYAVVKGKEHESGLNPEKDVIKAYGGHLIFAAGEARFSVIDVIRRETEASTTPNLISAQPFLEKHSLSVPRMREIVAQFKGKRVLVVGDLIIDEYIHCDALGMSQEDPTIVVTPVDTQRYIGGAGIVAGHVAGLGGEVRLITICGDDPNADSATASLQSLRVKESIIRDSSRPTILKQRFRATGKTLLRVSHLRSHDAGEEHVSKMLEQVERWLPETDILIFSDFNYGCLPQVLVECVTALCLIHNIPFLADSQASSQVSDVSRYRGAALISATEREARFAMNDFKSGVQNIANTLLAKSEARALLLKLGAEGVLILSAGQEHQTSSLPALNRNPVDVAGAGDAMLATAALAISAGANAWETSYLSSISAALQVAQLGNSPMQTGALLQHLVA